MPSFESSSLDPNQLDVSLGSFATEMACPCDVRSTPDSNQTADIAGGPVRADIVAKVS